MIINESLFVSVHLHISSKQLVFPRFSHVDVAPAEVSGVGATIFDITISRNCSDNTLISLSCCSYIFIACVNLMIPEVKKKYIV